MSSRDATIDPPADTIISGFKEKVPKALINECDLCYVRVCTEYDMKKHMERMHSNITLIDVQPKNPKETKYLP